MSSSIPQPSTPPPSDRSTGTAPGATPTPPGTTRRGRRGRRRAAGVLAAAAAALVAVAGAPGAAAQAGGFRTVEAPVDLGGSNGADRHVATAINERGRIAGWSENVDPGGGEPWAWIQWPARGIDRQDLPEPEHTVHELNDRAEVIIDHHATHSAIYRIGTGVIWNEFHDLPAGYHWAGARALNDRGEALLRVWPDGTNDDHLAVREHGGRWWVLGPGVPYDLNNEGLIAGHEGDLASDHGARARIWGKRGATQPLPVPADAHHSKALAVNNRGDVAGTYVGADGDERPVFWRLAGRPGWITNGVNEFRVVPVPEGYSCGVNELSDDRVIVGACTRPDGGLTAYAWHPSAGFVELAPLQPGDDAAALDVNETGSIVGYSGQRAVLWRVVP